MTEHRPIIGINTALEPDCEGGMTSIRPAYWEAIAQAGGIPLLMPQLEEPALIKAFLDQVDGFLMIGGDDLSSHKIGALALPTAVVLDPRRERSDFLLLEQLLERRIPTLSICLACQELNALFGGTLYQDLPFDGPPVLIRHYNKGGGPSLTHSVAVAEESLLGSIWGGASEVTVNSSHHQAVREVGAGLRRAAWAPDGITEAIEVVDHPFFIGVQWHPERMAGDSFQRKLFAALVRKILK